MIRRLVVAFATIAAGAADARAADTCASLRDGVTTTLGRAWRAMEPRGAVRAAGRAALACANACPEDADAVYLALRLLELGGAVFPVELLGEAAPDLRAAADRAHARHPRAGKIATVWARVVGSVEAARAAVELDPRWPPAQLALALALERADEGAAARRVLEALPERRQLRGASAALARIRYRLGDDGGALAAADEERSTISVGMGEPLTPAQRDLAFAEAAYVRALVELRRGHDVEAAKQLLVAATLGSADARARVQGSGGGLRAALSRLRAGGGVTPEQAALARELLGR